MGTPLASSATFCDAAVIGILLAGLADCVAAEPWSKVKLNLPVSCRSLEMNDRDPEETGGLFAFDAEN